MTCPDLSIPHWLLLPPAFIVFLLLLLKGSPRLRGHPTAVLLMDGHSVTFSQHIDHLWVSVVNTDHSKRRLLWRKLATAAIYNQSLSDWFWDLCHRQVFLLGAINLLKNQCLALMESLLLWFSYMDVMCPPHCLYVAAFIWLFDDGQLSGCVSSWAWFACPSWMTLFNIFSCVCWPFGWILEKCLNNFFVCFLLNKS